MAEFARMKIPRSQLLIVAGALVAAIAAFVVSQGSPPEPGGGTVQATVLPQPRPVPAFSLLDQHGEPIDEGVLTGDWHLVFFGFTNCPDICPLTLQTLTALRTRLATMPGPLPGLVFVSIDPARDAPGLLADYLAYFDPEILGITGDEEAISGLARQMGVAVFLGEADEHGDYTVDHSTAVFLVDPQGRLAALFRMPHETESMARDYLRITGGRG
jgi:protein SCO1